jgi:cystathionine gamma-synthase
VVHSATKFIGGHSDALGGMVVVPDADMADRLRSARSREGAVPGALETWLVLRGVRTLALRVERQSASAAAIAAHLAGRVRAVWYPWLASHPGHEVARRQMSAGGGVLSFEVQDDATAARVVANLRLFTRATSLGGVESLAEHRRSIDPAAPPGLIRLSVGLEGVADLIADLDRAFTA